MRWFRFIFLYAACFVGVSAAAAEILSPAAQLAALAERYYEAQARFDPLYSATLQGDNRFDDQLPIDIAPGERRARFAMYRDVQHQLARIPRGRLSASDALTLDLLAYELKTRLGFERYPDHLLPLQQLGAVPIQLATFASGQAEQPLQTVAQHEAYLKRIARLPAWIDQAIVNMREGMRRGIVQPRSVMLLVQPQLRDMGSEREEENPFLAPVRNLPASFGDADRQRLSEAYRQEVRGRIAPAMRRLALFVEREYLPACRDTVGWGALPEGTGWYRQWVRSQTTTELSPDQIHAMGLQEVARIQKELEKVAPKLGYDGDPHRLLGWVSGNPKFLPFRSQDEILAAYVRINDRVKSKLGQLFVRAPKATLDIRPEPELTRATASDHYSLPAEDGSRPGVFWAVINDPAAYDATTMTALFLHEGQPGHHFQMAMQQEMDLPKFRKRAWINAYGEGWALYAESLGAEMGLYEDPAAYVGELRLEIFRAARLVVDTGIHAKGWSRTQAIAYLVDTAGFTEKQAANQIDRYTAWPAQALGYKLGALKIQALRERAKQRLGDRFDLAAFHDTVLGEGPLPLAVLDAHVDRWIARELAKKP
jgi:uncharacterized protein (DUF885 family)